MELVVEKSQYEIERGKPMPSKFHSHLQFKIGKLIDRKYEDKFDIFPELSLSLSGENKIPDITFYKKGVVDIDFDQPDTIRINQIPLGVVEILSPKQNVGDLLIKSKYFFEAGVQSYWLVIPALRSIYIYDKEGDFQVFAKSETLLDETLGIELDLGKLFVKK